MWLIVTWWFNYTIIDVFKGGTLSKVHNLIKCKKKTKQTNNQKKWNQSILLIKNINLHEYLPLRFTYTKRHD